MLGKYYIYFSGLGGGSSLSISDDENAIYSGWPNDNPSLGYGGAVAYYSSNDTISLKTEVSYAKPGPGGGLVSFKKDWNIDSKKGRYIMLRWSGEGIEMTQSKVPFKFL